MGGQSLENADSRGPTDGSLPTGQQLLESGPDACFLLGVCSGFPPLPLSQPAGPPAGAASLAQEDAANRPQPQALSWHKPEHWGEKRGQTAGVWQGGLTAEEVLCDTGEATWTGPCVPTESTEAQKHSRARRWPELHCSNTPHKPAALPAGLASQRDQAHPSR